MHQQQLTDQARHCRLIAEDYPGRPERPILLKIALTFDELASGKRPERMPRHR